MNRAVLFYQQTYFTECNTTHSAIVSLNCCHVLFTPSLSLSLSIHHLRIDVVQHLCSDTVRMFFTVVVSLFSKRKKEKRGMKKVRKNGKFFTFIGPIIDVFGDVHSSFSYFLCLFSMKWIFRPGTLHCYSGLCCDVGQCYSFFLCLFSTKWTFQPESNTLVFGEKNEWWAVYLAVRIVSSRGRSSPEPRFIQGKPVIPTRQNGSQVSFKHSRVPPGKPLLCAVY